MKIGLDVRLINSSGIGTTIRGLLSGLKTNQLEKMTLFGYDNENLPEQAEFIKVKEKVYGLKQHWSYANELKKHSLTVFHMPHFDVPYFYRAPFISTVHDLIHILFPQFSSNSFAHIYARGALRYVSIYAKKIIVVSDNTKKDLNRLFPNSTGKTQVIYPGIDDTLEPIDNERLSEVLNLYQLTKGYFLYVGNLRGSKNTPFLIQTYKELRKRHKNLPDLVLVGKNFLPNLSQLIEPHIRYLGNIPNEDLAPLYSGAGLFVFPSLYEGFGLPPLEAMACGTPAIVSNVASLPEVCGDAALYFDPHDRKSLIDAVEFIMGSDTKQRELQAKGLERVRNFSWSHHSSQVWNLYESLVSGLS